MMLSTKEFTDRMQLAERLVRENVAMAARLRAENKLQAGVKVESGDGHETIVTKADIENGRRMIEAVRTEFPDDFVVDEEHALIPLTREILDSQMVWVADGIDGTNFFVKGLPYGVSLAACVQGVPVVAAVALDNGTVFATHRDLETVMRNGVPGNPPATHEPKQTTISVEGLDWLHDPETSPTSVASIEGKILTALRREIRHVHSLQSFVLQCSLVFDGGFTAVAHAGIDLFSAAAVWLIAKKLGLEFSRWNGVPFFPHALEVAANDYASYRNRIYRFDALVTQPQLEDRLCLILGPHSGEVEFRGRCVRFKEGV